MGRTSASRHTAEVAERVRERVAEERRKRKTTVQTYGNLVMEIADDGMPIRSVQCKTTLEAERIAALWSKN